jgi:DNA-binding CsgD family transcriptional regulator
MTTSPCDPPLRIDSALRNRVDALLAGRAHLVTVLVLQADPPMAQPLVVALVDRLEWPSDDDLHRAYRLTPRESEIARILASERLSSGEIAQRLGISVHTARRHVDRILAKLQINSRRSVRRVLIEAPSNSSANKLAGGL